MYRLEEIMRFNHSLVEEPLDKVMGMVQVMAAVRMGMEMAMVPVRGVVPLVMAMAMVLERVGALTATVMGMDPAMAYAIAFAVILHVIALRSAHLKVRKMVKRVLGV